MTEVAVKNKIIFTGKIRHLIVEGDAVDTIRFSIDRMYNDIDLADGSFILKYKLPSGTLGIDVCEVSHDQESVYADWSPQGGSTSESGMLTIQLQATIGEEIIWQTKDSRISIQSSLASSEEYEARGLFVDLDKFQESSNSKLGSDSKGILIPMYTHAYVEGSLSPEWQKLFDFKNNNPDIPVIIVSYPDYYITGSGGENIPTSGDDYDHLREVLDMSRSLGIKVYGYAWMNGTGWPVSRVSAIIDTWHEYYNIDGIFLDGMHNRTNEAGTIKEVESWWKFSGPKSYQDNERVGQKIVINGEEREINGSWVDGDFVNIGMAFSDYDGSEMPGPEQTPHVGQEYYIKAINLFGGWVVDDPLAYCLELRDYIQSKDPAYKVAWCTGTSLFQEYIDANAGDLYVLHEWYDYELDMRRELGLGGTQKLGIDGWALEDRESPWDVRSKCNKNEIVGIVHSQPYLNYTELRKMIYSYGWVYVTDGMYNADPFEDPYDIISNHLDEIAQEIRKLKIRGNNFEYITRVKSWLLNESYTLRNIVYTDGDIDSAMVVLPDNSRGVMENIVRDDFGISSIDYTFDNTYRFTVTRNAEGEITNTNIVIIGG